MSWIDSFKTAHSTTSSAHSHSNQYVNIGHDTGFKRIPHHSNPNVKINQHVHNLNNGDGTHTQHIRQTHSHVDPHTNVRNILAKHHVVNELDSHGNIISSTHLDPTHSLGYTSPVNSRTTSIHPLLEAHNPISGVFERLASRAANNLPVNGTQQNAQSKNEAGAHPQDIIRNGKTNRIGEMFQNMYNGMNGKPTPSQAEAAAGIPGLLAAHGVEPVGHGSSHEGAPAGVMARLGLNSGPGTKRGPSKLLALIDRDYRKPMENKYWTKGTKFFGAGFHGLGQVAESVSTGLRDPYIDTVKNAGAMATATVAEAGNAAVGVAQAADNVMGAFKQTANDVANPQSMSFNSNQGVGRYSQQ
jgi:hypothetical protein